MEQKPLLISFILDETRSMEKIKSEVIQGFNEYIETLKNDESSRSALFALTKFNSIKIESIYDGVPLEKVMPLSEKHYHPAAITPLYDVIGDTINVLKTHTELSTVLFVVQTDGEENASTKFSRKKILELIEDRKRSGWTFAFLGFDVDAFTISTTLGIPRGNTVSFTHENSRAAFRKAARAATSYAATGGEQTDSFFDDQENELDRADSEAAPLEPESRIKILKKMRGFAQIVADFKKRIAG